jgi:hypothetical protein
MKNILRLFVGYDEREAIGYHAFTQSVIEHAAGPVSITALTGEQRDGTNAFTYARFLVPYLCNFEGIACFVDGSDMLALDDIERLFKLFDPGYAVQVVKHDYQTKNPRKYIGTEMESENHDYPRKNWSSLILFDCGAEENRCLTPEYVASKPGSFLHRFSWLQDHDIGALPPEWNSLIDELEPVPNTPVKIAHFTLGIPAIEHYSKCTLASTWKATSERANRRPV